MNWEEEREAERTRLAGFTRFCAEIAAEIGAWVAPDPDHAWGVQILSATGSGTDSTVNRNDCPTCAGKGNITESRAPLDDAKYLTVQFQWHAPGQAWAAGVIRDGHPWILDGALTGMGATREAALRSLTGTMRCLILHVRTDMDSPFEPGDAINPRTGLTAAETAAARAALDLDPPEPEDDLDRAAAFLRPAPPEAG